MNLENEKNENLNARILAQLSASISKRKGTEVKLNDVMEYDTHRPSIDSYKREDFITARSRGSMALNQGKILVPSEIDKIAQENESFFSK
jgi:hypothetical protein